MGLVAGWVYYSAQAVETCANETNGPYRLRGGCEMPPRPLQSKGGGGWDASKDYNANTKAILTFPYFETLPLHLYCGRFLHPVIQGRHGYESSEVWLLK